MTIIKDKKANIIMMGSDLGVQGGVSEVEREYLNAGLDQKVNLVLIPSHIDGSKLEKLLQFFKAIKAYLFLPAQKPLIVHLHLSQGASFFRKLILTILAKTKRQKVILHLHGSDYEEFMFKSRLHTLLTRWLFDISDHVIVLSKRWEKILKEFTNNPNITTLYNPASKASVEPHGEGDIKVLFLGRLGERKGVYDLLDVISRDKNYYEARKVTFILAGDGETEKVKEIVTKNDLQGIVEVPGWVSGEAKDGYFKSAHILVLPSYNEQMPMSILEAMSRGYPVLATDIAGIPEMVEHGGNGFLFSPGNLDAFEEHLKTLCDDAQLRETMGARSRKITQDKFDSDLITDKLVQIYNDTTKRSIIKNV